jgi:mRNA interferase MazF
MNVRRGELWWVELDGTKGREQHGRRPALILSVDSYNSGASGMVILIPMTTTNRSLPVHVPVKPPEGGVTQLGFIMCEQIRAASIMRIRARLGQVNGLTLQNVEKVVRILTGL